MEDTYYFSQGRLAYTGTYAQTYNKFQDSAQDIEKGFTKDITKNNETGYTMDTTNNATKNGILSKLWNFQFYNKSELRYKL
jgi:hypothetical protein